MKKIIIITCVVLALWAAGNFAYYWEETHGPMTIPIVFANTSKDDAVITAYIDNQKIYGGNLSKIPSAGSTFGQDFEYINSYVQEDFELSAREASSDDAIKRKFNLDNGGYIKLIYTDNGFILQQSHEPFYKP